MSASTPPVNPVQRLQVLETVKTAYSGVFASLGPLFRAALLPFVLSLLINLMESTLPTEAFGPRFLLAVCGMFPYVIFAVAWHRFVLLGPAKADPKTLPPLGARHLRFAVALFALVAIMFGVVLALGLLMAHLMALFGGVPVGVGEQLGPASAPILLLALAFAMVILYVFLRLSFVLPAISVDEAYKFKDSWRNTRGQGWSLVGAVLLASLPLLLVGMILTLFFGMGVAQSEGPGFTVLSLFFLVSAALSYISSALTVSILSMAFRTCTGWYPGEDAGPPVPSQPEPGGDATY